jgi:hypothetical protein
MGVLIMARGDVRQTEEEKKKEEELRMQTASQAQRSQSALRKGKAEMARREREAGAIPEATQQALASKEQTAAEQKAGFAQALGERRGQLEQRAEATVDPLKQRAGMGEADIAAPSTEFRGTQQSLAQALQARAAGKAPSAAEMQLREAQERALKQSAAMAAGDRTPGGLRRAQTQLAEQQQVAGRESAILRAQEQERAEQALAQVAGQARGQDIQSQLEQERLKQSERQRIDALSSDLVAKQQAGQKLTADELAQLDQLNLQREQMVQDQIMQLTGISADQQAQILDLFTKANLTQQEMAQKERLIQAEREYAQIEAELNRELERGLATAAASAAKDRLSQQINSEKARARENIFGNVIGGGVSGAAGALATVFSDENLKENVEDGKEDVQSFLDALKAYKFNYKKESGEDPEADMLGVMAQDVEQGNKGMVIEKPEGKALDMKRGYSAVLASLAQMNDRLKELESKKRKK